MRKFTVRDLTLAAMVAALYAVLGYFGDIFGLTYGPIQCRFAEALTVLPFVFPAAAPGLVVGCFLTNLLSLYGPLDIIFGTLATAIAAWPPIIVNAIILPPMWAWAEVGAVDSAFWAACGFNVLTFIPGEALACYVLGTLLLFALPRVPALRPYMQEGRWAYPRQR